MSKQETSPHWMVPAFPIFQLHYGKANPAHYICVRMIHNVKPYPNEKTGRLQCNITKSLYNKNVLVSQWANQFHKELYPKMVNYNLSISHPANIYYGINLRKTIHGNKKENCSGFSAFALDMDSHKSYTKEQRWYQIQFLIDFGIPPTFVLGSGNGYHAYFVLKSDAPTVEGEAILKEMIRRAGCSGGQGGNTYDVTRILRLPGFYNQKAWWVHREENTQPPLCQIVWPPNWHESMTKREPLPRYDWEAFKQFPPCELGHIEKYKHAALQVHPHNDLETANYMRKIVKEHARLQAEGKLPLKAYEINQQTNQKLASSDHQNVKTKKQTWMPTLDIVPDVDDIKWGKGHTWMRTYVKKGFDGLTQKDLDKIQTRYRLDVPPSASELDAKIMHELIKQGYTELAVHDFWCRSDVKLYRPEKEKRSPNYFSNTYDKMLSMIKNSLIDASVTSAMKDQISDQVIIENNQTYIRSKDGSLELVLNASLVLKSICVNSDSQEEENREWYEIAALVPTHFLEEGVLTYPLFMPRNSFNDTRIFKKFLYDRMTLVTDRNSHLSRILNYMLTKYHEVPKKGFHTKMVYRKNQFIFPSFVIKKDGISTTTVMKESSFLQKQFPIWNWIRGDICSQEELKTILEKNWSHILNIHLPQLVFSIMGSIGATAIRPIMEEIGDSLFHIPTVNIRGTGCSGKTLTVMKLFSITGISGDEHKQSIKSTEFGISKLIGMMPIIPIIIDEFKIDENNERNITMVRDLIRRNYTGESATRGHADQTITISNTHGSLIVIGETPVERIGNVAEVSRLVPIDTYEFESSDHEKDYLAINSREIAKIGPHFFQFLLQQDKSKLLKKLNEIRISCVKKCNSFLAAEKIRIGHNLASLVFGCWLWNEFVSKISDKLIDSVMSKNPDDILIDTIRKWSKSEGQVSQIMITEDNKTYLTSVMINESLNFLKEIGTLIKYKDDEVEKFKDKLIPLYTENEKKDELVINLKPLYLIYLNYCQKHRKKSPPISVIRNQLKAACKRKSAYILKYAHPKKIDGKVVRAMVFKLSVMRQMEIWESPPKPSFDNEKEIENLQNGEQTKNWFLDEN